MKFLLFLPLLQYMAAPALAKTPELYLFYNSQSGYISEIDITPEEIAGVFDDEFGPAAEELPQEVKYEDFYVSKFPDGNYVFTLKAPFNCGRLGCLTRSYVRDADGNITEIRCTYDPASKPGAGEWRSVKGTIHWVSAEFAKEVELRIYDKLFTEAQMGSIPEGEDYKNYLNPDSLVVTKGYAEPALLEDNSGIAVQFERTGYFFKDPDSTPEHFVFNKTTSLKDSFKF